MAIIIIGGHSRDVGKTSVVAGLISALREFHWTALKVTQYGHGICAANGGSCDCATSDHSWALSEEKDRSGESDSSRFLVAGADRAFWVRTEQGRLAEAMPTLRRIIAAAQNVIIESNSIIRFLTPDIYMTVLDPATADFKASAREFLDRADAVILHQTEGVPPQWQRVSLKPAAGVPTFAIKPPNYVTEPVIEFVRSHLPAGLITGSST
jgi:molybdopterin-guanine dinucleotide biosynthesis protein